MAQTIIDTRYMTDKIILEFQSYDRYGDNCLYIVSDEMPNYIQRMIYDDVEKKYIIYLNGNRNNR